MPQQTHRPAGKRRAPKQTNKPPRWLVYAMMVLALFLVALLISSLAIPQQAEAPSSSLVSSLPPASSSKPVSSAPPLGPYDEKELPMLLNAKHPLPDDYEPELADVGYANGRQQTMQVRAAAAFSAMAEAAKADGITLSPFSAYRSHQHQVTNYNRSIENYKASGYTEEKAVELTQQYYAVPGTSEHEAGFSVDINGIEQSFEKTPAYAWLQEHCTTYGFILRYPANAEEITGIAYEPWHYRYVGANHAKIIAEKGITLEEYIDQLQMG